jgi:sugar/nucleoside kinase (ribokinase family)
MKLLSVGDLLLDVTVRYDPASGEAEAGGDAVRIGPGGSAANFAVHAARLGAHVRFVSRVGRDWPGEMLVRDLRDEGVKAEVRVIEGEPTGRVLVMVDPEGHRRMFSYPGASATLHPDDLDPGWFEGLDAFHLTGYSLLREGPREAALRAVRLAREGGARLVSLDPNPGHLIRDYGPERFREDIKGLEFDVIFPNLEEGRLLSNEGEPDMVAARLLDLAPRVVLTLGEEGCLVATRDGQTRVPAPGVDRVVDATGAGDAFAAGFVVEYARRGDAVAAARAGSEVAAQVVGRVGAR